MKKLPAPDKDKSRLQIDGRFTKGALVGVAAGIIAAAIPTALLACVIVFVAYAVLQATKGD